MNSINQLFFEIIRVSLGIQDQLSRVPTVDEWDEVHEIAKKQALKGIFYQGVLALSKDHRTTANLPMDQLLRWVGNQTLIKENNRKINKQCLKLIKYFSEEGFDCSILKGQGMAAIYRNDVVDLRLLRQPGDIDLWLGGGMHKVMRQINQLASGCQYDYKNVHAPFFSDTEVEVHWRPEILMNLFSNYELQKFWKSHESELYSNSLSLPEDLGEIRVPSNSLNRFYILLHTYRHMFDEGVGLRQVMDYYFVLLQKSDYVKELDTMKLANQFGMKKFAAALMWIMQEVFHLEDDKLLCPPDKKEGRFILDEIIKCGNFGQYDNRVKEIGGNGKMRGLSNNLQRAPHLILHYPKEVLWAPVWKAYHFVWKRTKGRGYNKI